MHSAASSGATRRARRDRMALPEVAAASRRAGTFVVDGIDVALLIALAAVSIWVLALVIAEASGHGRAWTGTDGVGLQDQMQYVAWIRDSARHGLASNLFVLRGTPHDYLQPLVALSGLVTALGVPAWLALLLWKPVAVGGVFFAIRAYVRRSVDGLGRRRAALILALFFVGPGQLIAQVIRHFGAFGRFEFPWHDVTLDPWIGWWSWGYPFGLSALAAMMIALLLYRRERDENHLVGLSPVFGALASWLHPWQGGTLIVVLVAAELGDFAGTRERRHVRRLVVTSVATALPLVYYGVLARTDSSWELGQAASAGSWPLWALVACELPLALPAALAYASRPPSFLGFATRVWPLAAVIVFVLSDRTGGFALHAFLGINVPLAVLAVEGWGRAGRRIKWLRLPAVAWLAVAVLVVPALADQLRWAEQTISASAQPPPPLGHGDAKFVRRGEAQALDYLARFPRQGGVLTRSYLGTVVPGVTGRRTYVGDSYWSPRFPSRAATSDALFLGKMSTPSARAFVRRTAADFILVDCYSRKGLDVALAPLIAATRRFGCAAVFVLR